MDVEWTDQALVDLGRLYDFLAKNSTAAAERAVDLLVAAPRRLGENPRIGKRLDRLDGREIRGVLAGNYEIHYEIVGSTVSVLRIWHTRENR